MTESTKRIELMNDIFLSHLKITVRTFTVRTARMYRHVLNVAYFGSYIPGCIVLFQW